jgi:Putative peptidoglycan binding domain
MKKLLTIFISCSLAIAASAIAQQQDEEQQQHKGKKGKEKTEAQAAPQATSAPKEHAGAKGHGQAQQNAHGQQNAPAQANATPKPETTPNQHAMTKGEKEPATENVAGTEQTGKGKKERGAQNVGANKSASPNPAAATTAQSPAAAANRTTAGNANANAKGKKPDRQVVQQVKAQHQNFRAQPKPDKVPAVTFNQTYRIQGAEQWQGPQYVAFRNYHPEWHDQGWYRSHFNRVELIGGGYYYWNNGYWYPAWGYDSSAQYYAYDAPIYVGHSAEPPDRVIADVQGVLQQMGYYQGEVDGLLGPQTREALAAYQRDNGLYATAVIDEPTLDSLGMAS